jgi:hypothetical protein
MTRDEVRIRTDKLLSEILAARPGLELENSQGQTGYGQHRQRHARSTSNSGNVYRQVSTAGQCQYQT